METLPDSWLSYAANPRRSFIAEVQRELEAEFALGDAASFYGFCNAPRYFHPSADPDALVLSLELISWYFYFDDPLDAAAPGDAAWRQVDRMVALLATGELPSAPTGCERLCHRYLSRARALCSSNPSWVRFANQCAAWVASIRPLHRGLATEIPSVARYKELRVINVGILPLFTVNEIISNLSLTRDFLASELVRRLGELAALVVALVNDVYSYERESRQGTQWNSLELRRMKAGTLAQAYEEHLADLRSMVSEMQHIEQLLALQGEIGISMDPSDAMFRARREQSRYVQGIKDIVVGNMLWSQADSRYVSPSSPFVELRKHRPDRRVRAAIRR